MKKELEHYLRLPYPMEIVEDEEGGYFGHFPDLPGCMAQGETIEEVVKNLEVAKRAWIEVRLEDGLDIPSPHEVVEDYSGRFLLRLPKSLHQELTVRARREGTSLNQYVLHLISLALGGERREKQVALAEQLKQLDLYAQFLAGLQPSTAPQAYLYPLGRRVSLGKDWFLEKPHEQTELEFGRFLLSQLMYKPIYSWLEQGQMERLEEEQDILTFRGGQRVFVELAPEEALKTKA